MIKTIRDKGVHPVSTKIQDPNRQRGAQPERESYKRPKKGKRFSWHQEDPVAGESNHPRLRHEDSGLEPHSLKDFNR